MAMPEPGKKAPAFNLATDSGDKLRLSELKGKRVVLFAFPKALTSGCTREAQAFRDAMTRFKRRKVQVLGISNDPPERLAKFKEKYDLNFPLLSDESTQTLRKYGIWQQKNMYGRKFMGTVRSTFLIGADGKIQHVWPKVRVDGHVDDVLDVLSGKKVEPKKAKRPVKKATRKKKARKKKKTSRRKGLRKKK